MSKKAGKTFASYHFFLNLERKIQSIVFRLLECTKEKKTNAEGAVKLALPHIRPIDKPIF